MSKTQIERKEAIANDYEKRDKYDQDKCNNDINNRNLCPSVLICEKSVLWYHLDHLNSTKATTDELGKMSTMYEYRAFGEELKKLGSGDAKYTYGGKELDDETNLYYFNARYYDATIGRFINVDPIQDGLNWYVYCNNNPLSFKDPTGLWTLQIGGSLNACFGPSATVSGGIILGFNKNGFQLGVYREESVGIGLAGVSATINVGWSNNDDIKKIEKTTKSGGVSAGEGVSFGAEMSVADKKDNDVRPVYSGSVGFGVGIPVEIHTNVANDSSVRTFIDTKQNQDIKSNHNQIQADANANTDKNFKPDPNFIKEMDAKVKNDLEPAKPIKVN